MISRKNSKYKSRVCRVALLSFVGACGTLFALPWANVNVPVPKAMTVWNYKPGNFWFISVVAVAAHGGKRKARTC